MGNPSVLKYYGKPYYKRLLITHLLLKILEKPFTFNDYGKPNMIGIHFNSPSAFKDDGQPI